MVESVPEVGQTIKIAIIGGTGAVGREVVERAIAHPRVSEIVIVLRRYPFHEWQEMPDYRQKCKVITKETFEAFEESEVELLRGSNAFICTLGSRWKESEEVLTRVEGTYPLSFAKLALELKVPHFCHLSAEAANSNSYLYFLRNKARTEELLSGLGLPQLTICKPGLIENRRNDKRLTETILSWVPFMRKIDAG